METLKKQNWGMIISLMLWCAITLIRVLNHSPWYDEAHAWVISQELNFVEIIKFMKTEGHTFLWYLCLMPFSKTNFMYPYSMLLLNWLFCFIAIIILWLKAPFNNWVKFFISFSFPFLAMYSVVARCYAIGIMFLFALAAMEKSKLKHPNWYSLLLILCANTSIMAVVGATVFGLIFIFELIKNKRNLIIPFSIMFLGAVLILLQLFGSSNNIFVESRNNNIFSLIFINTFFQNILLNKILLALFSCLALLVYFKNKIFPFFLISTYILLMAVFCQYRGYMWHWFFFYIYFIISTWLLFDKYSLKLKNILITLLCVISVMYIFFRPIPNLYRSVYQDFTKTFQAYIKNSELLSKSNLIICDYVFYSLIPYFKDNDDITIQNYCSGELGNYNTVAFSRSEYCYYDENYKTNFVYSQIEKVYDENKKNIFLGMDIDSEVFICDESSKCYKFTPVDINDKIYIHLVSKVDNN